MQCPDKIKSSQCGGKRNCKNRSNNKKDCVVKQCCDKIAFLLESQSESEQATRQILDKLSLYYNFTYQVFDYNADFTEQQITALLDIVYAQGFRCIIGPNFSGVLRNSIPWLIDHPDVQLVSTISGAPGLGRLLPPNAYRFLDSDAYLVITVESIKNRTGSAQALILAQAGDDFSQKNALALQALLGGSSASPIISVNLTDQTSADQSVLDNLAAINAAPTIYFSTLDTDLPFLLQALVNNNITNIASKDYFTANIDNSAVSFPAQVILPGQGLSADPLLLAFGITPENINTSSDANNFALTIDAARWLRSCRSDNEGLTGYIAFRPGNQDRVATLGLETARQAGPPVPPNTTVQSVVLTTFPLL